MKLNNPPSISSTSYSYRDIVMNFVCNMRRLGMYDELVVAAFDEDMYRFGFAMGLPIFYYQVSAKAFFLCRNNASA